MSQVSSIFLWLLYETSANWLLQCSSCVDQTYFADEKLKSDVIPADTATLLDQVKRIQVQTYAHKEEEFFNKFFNRTQLGILAQDLAAVLPEAVALVPERRYTNAAGVSLVNKEVLMIRDSQLLFSALGALNHLAHDFDMQENIVQEHGRSLGFVKEEQELNKKKREEIMEQLLKTIAMTEVIGKVLQSTELRFSDLETNFALVKQDTQTNTEIVKARILEVEEAIGHMKKVLEKEAHTDLVEKRKKSEIDLEKSRVLKEIETLRYEEEQKTIQLRNKEKRESEEAIIAMHKEKIKFEQQGKLDADLRTIDAQEASNLRQQAEKAKHEKEIKLLDLESQKYKADQELKEAIERARIEEEMKIKAARENEDINAREQKMKLESQKQQVIVAIQATAKIVMAWVQALYGSTQNTMYALGSFLAVMAGIYFTRELAILLREQLNKRLGRPSLVRVTSKKTRVGEFLKLMRSVFCLGCLCRKRAGHEFDDVVLHKRLEEQIVRLANATRNAKQRGMPLLHIMFYGPPGTGKTMCAQRFAEYSGLEYAFMSGADVAPLEEQAVTELHKLFTWVHKSRKGVLLFIDEADAFLAVRNKAMSESLRNALTTMLYHTGTPTSQFLMVLATNRPGDLDPAVLDRIDESVEFGLPDLFERERMCLQYFNMYVTKPLHIKLNETKNNKPGKKPLTVETGSESLSFLGDLNEECDKAVIAEVARRLKTFSGREISKLFTGLQTHICAHMTGGAVRSRNLKLSKKTLLDVVSTKVEEHNRTLDVLAKGYAYVHKEGASPSLSGSNHIFPAVSKDSPQLGNSTSRMDLLRANLGENAYGNPANININISNNNLQQEALFQQKQATQAAQQPMSTASVPASTMDFLVNGGKSGGDENSNNLNEGLRKEEDRSGLNSSEDRSGLNSSRSNEGLAEIFGTQPSAHSLNPPLGGKSTPSSIGHQFMPAANLPENPTVTSYTDTNGTGSRAPSTDVQHFSIGSPGDLESPKRIIPEPTKPDFWVDSPDHSTGNSNLTSKNGPPPPPCLKGLSSPAMPQPVPENINATSTKKLNESSDDTKKEGVPSVPKSSVPTTGVNAGMPSVYGSEKQGFTKKKHGAVAKKE